MEMKLDDETMQTFVAKVLFDSFTLDQREKLVQQAIKGMLEKPATTGYGGDRRSVLQRAFDYAAEHVAQRIVTEHLTTDATFIANVKSLMVEATERAFNVDGGGREKMVSAISEAIIAGLRPKERY